MRLFDTRPFHRRDDEQHIPYPRPPWYRRWWFIVLVVTVLLAVAALAIWQPWRSPCGPGLTAEGTPYVCVGLDVDSTALQAPDPLADLEAKIVAQNGKITGGYATIVLLDNMTPDPNTDSVSLTQLRDRVEGAITAAWRANNQAVAGGRTPQVKLLLASFGSGASYEDEAVRAIVQARASQHVVAVTGFGQSLDQTRQAAKELSDVNIVSVGSTVSADNMNDDATGRPISTFFRVSATNKDSAEAEVSYIADRGYRKALLVKDVNSADSYNTSLAADFSTAFRSRYGLDVPFTEPYQSPKIPVNSATRDTFMTDQFAHMHSDICADKPDVIYFAGRGVDLMSFLKALSQAGACGLGPIDVLTGDDMVDQPLPPFPTASVRVFYTALATADEWRGYPPSDDTTQDYTAFAAAFSNQDNGFDPKDLQAEDAIMSHDAVLAAALAARLDPLAATDPSTVKAYFLRLRCTQFVPGASGDIAFDGNGNPVDKAVPLLQLMPDGSVVLREVTWPTGTRFDPKTTC
jgi:ABC-type branched-subunit amino acid transport system substrate-binding protein